MKGRRYTIEEVDYLKSLKTVKKDARLRLIAEFGISEMTYIRILKSPERFLNERNQRPKGSKQRVVFYKYSDESFTLLGGRASVPINVEELTVDSVPFSYYKDWPLELVQSWSDGISLSYSKTKYIRNTIENSELDTIEAFKELLERFSS